MDRRVGKVLYLPPHDRCRQPSLRALLFEFPQQLCNQHNIMHKAYTPTVKYKGEKITFIIKITSNHSHLLLVLIKVRLLITHCNTRVPMSGYNISCTCKINSFIWSFLIKKLIVLFVFYDNPLPADFYNILGVRKVVVMQHSCVCFSYIFIHVNIPSFSLLYTYLNL